MALEKVTGQGMATRQSMASIYAAPGVGQSVEHRGTKYTTIKEGLGYILVPHGTPTSADPKLSKEDSQKQSVFYNPIQQFNRDLSVLAIKAYGEDLMARRKAQLEKKQKKQLAQLKQKQRKAKPEGLEGSRSAQCATPANEQKTNEDGIEGEGDLPSQPPMKKRKTDEVGNSIAVSNAPETSTMESATTVAEDAKSETIKESLRSGGDVPAGDKASSSKEKIPFKILDALSATGLRALRYAQEIPFATSITANDMSEKATNSISLNIKHNKLDDKITAHTGNAIAYMYSFVDKSGFDVIDLDPYGTAAPFLDASLQAISDGGLLCVTCTDSAIFASHGYLEKTFSQYGGLPLKGEACHEGGLRLVLHAVASSAARYGLAIEPLLSLSIDYYVRVFVRVRKSPNDVKMHAGKSMIVYNCDSGCGAWTPQFMARHRGKPNRKGETVYKHSFAQAPSTSSHCEHCGQKNSSFRTNVWWTST
jgi:tRNA (guanine26-N2/guanine27-N2)-dimethyltransferase